MLGAFPAAAEELDTGGIHVSPGDPLDTLDYEDPGGHDILQESSADSANQDDDSVVFVVPGFQNRYYLIKLEFSKGLPRLRIEEVKLEKRRMGD